MKANDLLKVINIATNNDGKLTYKKLLNLVNTIKLHLKEAVYHECSNEKHEKLLSSLKYLCSANYSLRCYPPEFFDPDTHIGVHIKKSVNLMLELEKLLREEG